LTAQAVNSGTTGTTFDDLGMVLGRSTQQAGDVYKLTFTAKTSATA
jgi:hypothetical protein